jgi:hypothetical protein
VCARGCVAACCYNLCLLCDGVMAAVLCAVSGRGQRAARHNHTRARDLEWPMRVVKRRCRCLMRVCVASQQHQHWCMAYSSAYQHTAHTQEGGCVCVCCVS